jgi:translocation and assembly module TamB
VVRHRSIRFFQAQGVLGGAHVSAIGELLALDPLGMQVKGHLDWQPSGQPAYVLDGSAHGDLNALNVVAHTASPFRADISGQLRDLTNHLHWVASATVRQFDLGAWGISGPLGTITGHLTGSGDTATFTASGPVNPAGLRAGVFDVQFEGGFADHVLTAKHLEARHVDSGARVRGSGTIAMVDHGPRLDLRGSWEQFRWPLVGRDPAVRSSAGSFALEGIMPYHVRITGDMRAMDLPLMPVDITGRLDKSSFSFERADVDLYGGHTTASGSVIWAPQEAYTISGNATGIDPAKLRPDLPGSLNFDYAVSGRGFDPRGTLGVSFSALSGRLRGAPASGGGTFTHAGKTWTFTNLRVGLGTTTLALDGEIDDRIDLRFALAAQDLSLLAPGSHGVVKASGTFSGTLAEPVIAGVAHVVGVEYQGIKLEGADADVDFEPGAVNKESSIDVRVHGLHHGHRTLDAASFTLHGPPSAYSVHFSASAPGIDLTAQAHGAYAGGSFLGQLSALGLSGKESALHLTLDRPVGLLVAPDHVRLEWLCLVGTPGSVCADGEWRPAEWSSTVMTNQLPLATLTAGMTPSVQYLGTINALARLFGGAATPLQGTLRAELVDAEIAHRLASRKIEHTRIGSGTLGVTLTPSLVTAQADLGDGEVGTMHAGFDAQRTTSEWLQMPLSGEVHAQSAEMDLISLYVPDIDRAAGHFNADMQLTGTLGEPRLAGVLKVSDGQIDVYQVNLSLRQISLEARLSDSGVGFKGSAVAGNGTVNADGQVEWRNLLPYGKFHLQGTNLRVTDIPEAVIDASPDLDFSISGHKIEVTGKVLVPYAKIQPKDITNAVRASDDEIIVGAEPDDPAKRFEVLSTITLSLGERVSIDTLGLSAKLGGNVVIRSGYDAITRATGELSILDGKYAAYARQLDIDRGRLIFTGGPIDNPGIDLRAKKVFPDVTAYLTVRGTLLQPRMSFSSDPPLPQSQIVSLILAGGSLDTAQNRGGNIAIGQGVAMLAQQYGSLLGIQEAGLESDLNNETSVVLGRYLNPRLYVSYGISLTEQLNTFKVRYTLGDHWTIKAEVGQDYGADLVYTIVR